MINWFPGHMNKATKKIREIKPLDLIIEVVDARAIESSKNNELTTILNKPVLTIATKSDLATKKGNDSVLIGSVNDKSFREVIIKKLYKMFEQKINKLKEKGLFKPIFYIMVVGLPNVGKTSLINLLAKNKKLEVQNKPGVTRSCQLIKVNENFFVYDTPGVMMKKINEEKVGFILCLLNIIRSDIIPLDEVSEWAFNFYKNNYPKQMESFFFLKDISNLSKDDFFIQVANKYGFILKQGGVDIKRSMQFFLNTIKEGKICKVNYEN